MISILLNFQLHSFKYSFKIGRISICSASIRYFSNSQFSCQTLSSHFLMRKKSSCKSIRYIYTSDNELRRFNEVFRNENKKNENSIIYNGALTYQVKGVKVFTCITSLGGIIIQPLIVQNILNGNNMPLGVAVFCCVGFFTFLTPFIIHLITKKYVTEIWYDSATDTYTATVLSFFLQKVNISFKIEDVTVPSMLPIFSTMSIKGRPVFIVSDSFLDMEHYIKMMGYDKPIDMKMNLIPTLPRDIVVPPSALKRRCAICTIKVVPNGRHYLERRNGISIDRSEHGLFIRMVGPSGPLPSRSKRLSQSDWLLLEALDTRHKRPHQTGRFLTMHKRRRKRLITRSLTQDHALLDDIHHGQVQCILDKVNQWPFNAFILDNVTGGRSLPVLCVHLFHWYGLLDYFKLDVVRCWKFFTLIEEGYHSSNPYHNSIHATDVTQAMHCFLQEKKIREYLTPLEIMASLIAAVTHDLDHPGVNQPFLIATSNHLAALYENSSVLENHHWRSAIGCLLESHIAEELEDWRPELQRQISSLILATDITRQQEFLLRFKRYLDQNLLDMKLEEHRHFILQIALKCADISNPCRPWEVSKKWSQKVCEEFFRQGDYEKQLNLPVTALCDRQSTSVPKIQAGFFTFVVYPLFEEWHRFLGKGLSDDMMKNLRGNKVKWDALISQENADDCELQNPVANPAEDEVKEFSARDVPVRLEASPSKTSSKTNLFSFRNRHFGQKVGRRHSVPLSVPEPSPFSRTVTRRESVAIGEKKFRRFFQSRLLVEEEECDDDDAEDGGEQELEQEERKEKELTSPVQGPLSVTNRVEESEEAGEGEKRPLSSENLLPDLSITSMTTVTEAIRLSGVLNKGKPFKKKVGKSQLTRQQTFPPIQTCFRQRYFSTTAEMSKLTNNDLENVKSSTGSDRESEKPSETQNGHAAQLLPKAVVLKEQNRSTFSYGDVDKQNNKWKMDGPSHEKGLKVAKLLDDILGDTFEKENIDPHNAGTTFDDEGSLCTRSNSTWKNSLQGHLSRRRGSAPVASEIMNPMALALRVSNDRYPRRGSVPVNAIRCNTNDENLPITQDISVCSSQQHCPYQRRGSIPSEAGCPETTKPRNRNKKSLRRRRSGGPEMFCFSENGNENVRLKAEILPKRPGGESISGSMITRRRGSLPIDVLLITHSGDHRETHDS